MRTFPCVLFFLMAAWICQDNLTEAGAQQSGVVPAPKAHRVIRGEGFEVTPWLALRGGMSIAGVADHLQVFGQALATSWGIEAKARAGVASAEGDLVVEVDATLKGEAYRVHVGRNIRVEVSTIHGLAHATATLLQIWRPVGETISAQIIEDQPAVPFRCFMIDLGRNPHGIAQLEELIDLAWFYKLSSLQLHLTDDQLFAFPSARFPKLQSKRGRISREEFVALDRYAAARGVEIIPELEAPGHSSILRRVYPDIFGKTPTDLAQSPASCAGLTVLIDEMLEIFKTASHVHVGGDEAYGVPHKLQRDLVNYLHAHVKKRGRKTLVWEGPKLGKDENKINPDVIHINWRTIDFPAQEMLDAGYPVVNAAWDPLYIVDHYPRNNFTMVAPQRVYERLERFTFGHFNPSMKTFAKPHRTKASDRVIGYCMPWWEGREENFLPQILPRLIPMAAVAWAEPTTRDFEVFEQQARAVEVLRYRAFHPVAINASPLAVESAGVFHRRCEARLELRTESKISGEATIRYTLDGRDPGPDSPRYERPFAIEKTTLVRAALFIDGVLSQSGSRRTFVKVDPEPNLALGKAVEVSVPEGPLFCAARLTDGGTGNLDYFLGYPTQPKPIEITVDLGKECAIDRVVVCSYHNAGRSFESYELLVSQDGATFVKLADRREKPKTVEPRAIHDFEERRARFVRILAHGHKGQVFDSFTRITEIQVFDRP